jgi:hypothetical protein
MLQTDDTNNANTTLKKKNVIKIKNNNNETSLQSHLENDKKSQKIIINSKVSKIKKTNLSAKVNINDNKDEEEEEEENAFGKLNLLVQAAETLGRNESINSNLFIQQQQQQHSQSHLQPEEDEGEEEEMDSYQLNKVKHNSFHLQNKPETNIGISKFKPVISSSSLSSSSSSFSTNKNKSNLNKLNNDTMASLSSTSSNPFIITKNNKIIDSNRNFEPIVTKTSTPITKNKRKLKTNLNNSIQTDNLIDLTIQQQQALFLLKSNNDNSSMISLLNSLNNNNNNNVSTSNSNKTNIKSFKSTQQNLNNQFNSSPTSIRSPLLIQNPKPISLSTTNTTTTTTNNNNSISDNYNFNIPSQLNPTTSNQPVSLTTLMSSLSAVINTINKQIENNNNNNIKVPLLPTIVSPSPLINEAPVDTSINIRPEITQKSLRALLNTAMATMGREAVAKAAANVLTSTPTTTNEIKSTLDDNSKTLSSPIPLSLSPSIGTSYLINDSSLLTATTESMISNDFCTRYRKRIQQARDRLLKNQKKSAKPPSDSESESESVTRRHQQQPYNNYLNHENQREPLNNDDASNEIENCNNNSGDIDEDCGESCEVIKKDPLLNNENENENAIEIKAETGSGSGSGGFNSNYPPKKRMRLNDDNNNKQNENDSINKDETSNNNGNETQKLKVN